MTDQPAAKDAAEKRRFVRRKLLTQAIFVSRHIRLKSAVTIDISTGGMSLTLPEPIDIGQACVISFDVPAEINKLRSLVKGTIASCVAVEAVGYRVGVQYVESDPVSRQLIEAAVEHYLRKA
jgi:c-di-GMP-binding flagellar brake protein YcgR